MYTYELAVNVYGDDSSKFVILDPNGDIVIFVHYEEAAINLLCHLNRN